MTDALREALELARNRLRAAAINEAPKGGARYYEYSQWADEADEALSAPLVVGSLDEDAEWLRGLAAYPFDMRQSTRDRLVLIADRLAKRNADTE